MALSNAVPPELAGVSGRNSLKAHAQRAKLWMGAAVNVNVLQKDALYRAVLAEQFDMVVAEREMKWDVMRPAPDQYSFALGDELAAFARRHRMKLRGHNFVWHEELPGWFAGTVTATNARQFLTEHILTVGRHYAGQVESWDVVNEAVLPSDGRADGLRDSPWLKLLGPGYIELAFRTARMADPHAQLMYNDYGVEYDSDEDEKKRHFILELLRGLKAKGFPLDGLGVQSHIKAGSKETIGAGLQQFMSAVSDMGLDIFLTELDVNEDDLTDNDVAVRDRVIAETYAQFLDVALANDRVRAVLTWGVNDAHTWLNNIPSHRKKHPERPQRALLFDSEYRPKPDFYAVRDCFDQAAARRRARAASHGEIS